MIRILSTVEIDEEWIEAMPDWERLAPGLIVNLDVKERESFLVEPGSTVRIHRPDGTFIERTVTAASPPGMPSNWTYGLILADTKRHEVPARSEVELPPFCIPLFPPGA
jgi:hypothetical protein